MLAQDLQTELESVGAIVVGPVSSVAEALDCIDETPSIDVVLLDLRLQGELAYPVADVLMASGIPFLFASGYDESDVTTGYPGTQNCAKPFSVQSLTKSLEAVLRRSCAGESDAYHT